MLLAAILQENKVTIEDGVTELPPFAQTTGLAQGDNLSPLLFSVLLKDLPGLIRGPRELVKVLMYADDLVVYGESRFQVQQAIARLNSAIPSLGLTINEAKTEAIKFRRGGRLAARDTLFLAGEPVRYVEHFQYLGIIVTPSARSFTAHVNEKCRKAVSSFSAIHKPHLLSLKAALRLFDMKIAPIASYGIELIWEDLTVGNLESYNRLKASFLKRALVLHRCAAKQIGLPTRGYAPVHRGVAKAVQFAKDRRIHGVHTSMGD
jgi:hypothetical protein